MAVPPWIETGWQVPPKEGFAHPRDADEQVANVDFKLKTGDSDQHGGLRLWVDRAATVSLLGLHVKEIL